MSERIKKRDFEIYTLYCSGQFTQAELGTMYGVDQSTISRAIHDYTPQDDYMQGIASAIDQKDNPPDVAVASNSGEQVLEAIKALLTRGTANDQEDK